jgi:hypothetical protein
MVWVVGVDDGKWRFSPNAGSKRAGWQAVEIVGDEVTSL